MDVSGNFKDAYERPMMIVFQTKTRAVRARKTSSKTAIGLKKTEVGTSGNLSCVTAWSTIALIWISTQAGLMPFWVCQCNWASEYWRDYTHTNKETCDEGVSTTRTRLWGNEDQLSREHGTLTTSYSSQCCGCIGVSKFFIISRCIFGTTLLWKSGSVRPISCNHVTSHVWSGI